MNSSFRTSLGRNEMITPAINGMTESIIQNALKSVSKTYTTVENNSEDIFTVQDDKYIVPIDDLPIKSNYFLSTDTVDLNYEDGVCATVGIVKDSLTNYYTKTEIDEIKNDLSDLQNDVIDLDVKFNHYYTDDEIDEKEENLQTQIDNRYTKEEVDALIEAAETGDVDLTNYYTKTQADELFVKKTTTILESADIVDWVDLTMTGRKESLRCIGELPLLTARYYDDRIFISVMIALQSDTDLTGKNLSLRVYDNNLASGANYYYFDIKLRFSKHELETYYFEGTYSGDFNILDFYGDELWLRIDDDDYADLTISTVASGCSGKRIIYSKTVEELNTELNKTFQTQITNLSEAKTNIQNSITNLQTQIGATNITGSILQKINSLTNRIAQVENKIEQMEDNVYARVLDKLENPE